jgi:MoaA/NifB/PqqE/SkfB family radical SAM enzyme
MRNSLYWDNFCGRIDDTVAGNNKVSRVAVFITSRCNLRCKYCNHITKNNVMEESVFDNIVKNNPGAIVHITGGEPSMVPWLYDYLKKNGNDNQFHLNTNAVLPTPAESVKRLKISLDSCDKEYWDDLVGVKGTFDKVLNTPQPCHGRGFSSIHF